MRGFVVAAEEKGKLLGGESLGGGDGTKRLSISVGEVGLWMCSGSGLGVDLI